MDIIIDQTMLKFLINSFIKEVRKKSAQLGANIKESLIQDGTHFLRRGRRDIERWTLAVTMGEMSKADFVWLLRGKKDLAEMNALKQQGLTEARIDELREEIMHIVMGTIFSFANGGLNTNTQRT